MRHLLHLRLRLLTLLRQLLPPCRHRRAHCIRWRGQLCLWRRGQLLLLLLLLLLLECCHPRWLRRLHLERQQSMCWIPTKCVAINLFVA